MQTIVRKGLQRLACHRLCIKNNDLFKRKKKFLVVPQGEPKNEYELMDFDQFANLVVGAKLDPFVAKNSLQSTLIEEDFPWNFTRRVATPRDQNLKSAIQIDTVLSEERVLEIFNAYLRALEEQDSESMLQLTEKSLYKRIQALWKDMNLNK